MPGSSLFKLDMKEGTKETLDLVMDRKKEFSLKLNGKFFEKN